ncbi:YciI family protein [Paractinoplanes hotanensis]|uniref:YciI family protein n=1 Tax=Paractinoplanes hotanensis TaxID=2906497 RepID=A0ABT0YEQ3_9ACTN|nr:YciI family protein [Actinoplanes hotanensis]MCM4083749.1 YciI family protein [Actinoplanes hotanensis]
MKYNVMMFGDGGEMAATADPAWVRDMMTFMGDFNAELAESGELVEARGLAFPSTAKTVSYEDGQVAVTDGPYAETKESLAGFWVLEVPGEERAVELAGRVAFWARKVELREVPDGPPDHAEN